MGLGVGPMSVACLPNISVPSASFVVASAVRISPAWSIWLSTAPKNSFGHGFKSAWYTRFVLISSPCLPDRDDRESSCDSNGLS